MADFATIPFHDKYGAKIAILHFYTLSENSGIFFITEGEANSSGEAQVQLFEGGRYEYELEFFDNAFSFKDTDLFVEFGDESGMFVRSKSPTRPHTGIFSPGLYTGQLSLCLRTNGVNIAHTSIEVISRKLSYKTDYRIMLDDITAYAVDLLMELRSPSQLKAISIPSESPTTLTQRFFFLRSLIGSQQFQDALHRIITHPHHGWDSVKANFSINKRFKPTGKVLRQIARPAKGTLVPESHPLNKLSINFLPEKIDIHKNVICFDTAENRFVKFALNFFTAFLKKMRSVANSMNDTRLSGEISSLIKKLENSLTANVFHAVSELDSLPYGSPVLQQKDGYREIFQAWLRFDMAARLVWRGGNDVYSAGQKNIATLYEYWTFFKIMEILCTAFDILRPKANQFLEETSDGFGLKLKSGIQMDFMWTAPYAARQLKIRYSYNRSFSHSSDCRVVGSWTERMRPDYTVSIWPAAFSADQAEEQELMTHIHFDAKYRIENVQQLFGISDEELSKPSQSLDSEIESEKREQKEGRYKRDDLLKMHAYRDAIRRTEGAYIIYPGSESRHWQGYHEILPSLGAFSLRPNVGGVELEEFFKKVASHLCNRASSRERLNYHTYNIYHPQRTPTHYNPSIKLPCVWPEKDRGVRLLPPAEIQVLVGFCNDMDFFNWILKHNLYIIPMASGLGSQFLLPKFSISKYLLLQNISTADSTLHIINEKETRFFSRSDLESLGYPSLLDHDYFLVFAIDIAVGFERYKWSYFDISEEYVTTLEDILNHATTYDNHSAFK